MDIINLAMDIIEITNPEEYRLILHRDNYKELPWVEDQLVLEVANRITDIVAVNDLEVLH